MRPKLQFRAQAHPRWTAAAAGVMLVLAIVVVAPQLSLFRATPIPVVAAVGLAGFYLRRNVLDAASLVAAHLLAEFFGEPLVGPYALAIVTLGVLAVSGRPRFALFCGGALFALLLASIALKSRFAGSLLSWQDLRYFFLQFGDNVGVFASQPTLLTYAAGATMVLGAGAVVAWRHDGRINARAPGSRTVHYSVRGLAVVMTFWCASELNAAATGASLQPAWLFSERSGSTPVSTFLSTLHLQPTPRYERVDTRVFSREVAAFVKAAPVATPPADIVLFLQESQFNPLAIGGCPRPLCEFGVFQADERTTDHGEMRVHTYGGGTWVSEFALATGLPQTLYGRAGEFAPFNIAPGVQRSFVRSLKAAGYYTIGVNPVAGGLMNARTAYHAYGFDEFLDAGDLGLPGGFDTPDQAVHDAALRVLRAARQHGKPVFLFALTIFNHGEHGVRMSRVPRSLRADMRRASGSDIERDNLADYVWRTNEFERAYQGTRAAALGSTRPAVLAWFGDHQPPFGNAPAMRDRVYASGAQPAAVRRYLTWYDIATNAEHPHANATRRRLDVVFLPGLLAQRAGAPLDDWLAANVLTRERCGGLLDECTDPAARNTYFSYLLRDLRAIR